MRKKREKSRRTICCEILTTIKKYVTFFYTQGGIMANKEKEDLRIVRTRKLLSNTLLDLMEKESIEKISVIDLCNTAMINRATFYAHFEDKYHLLNFALEELKDELYESFTHDKQFTDPFDALRSIVLICADFVFDNRNHIYNILRVNRNEKVLATIEDSLVQCIKYQLGKYKATYDFLIPSTVIATFLAGGLVSTTLLVIDNPDKYSYDDMISYIPLISLKQAFKLKAQ